MRLVQVLGWVVKRLPFVFLLVCAGCGIVDSPPNASIILMSSYGNEEDIRAIDGIILKSGFGPHKFDIKERYTIEGRVEYLRYYQLLERTRISVSIGYLVGRSMYRVWLSDYVSQRSLGLKGLSCRKYLAILADMRATFGEERIIQRLYENTCDPVD